MRVVPTEIPGCSIVDIEPYEDASGFFARTWCQDEFDNRVLLNQAPMGEPQLGKRGLYHAMGGTNPKEREHAMLWLLNQSDGNRSLLSIAERSGLDLTILQDDAAKLEAAGLLSEAAEKA